MKILVAYYSETGNTQKIAEAIFDAIDVEKECKSIQDITSVEGYDLIFFGFPVQMHSVPTKAAVFMGQIQAGQKIAFFSTHGSLRGGQLPQQALEHAVSLAAKLKVFGHFNCRGKVNPKIIDALEKDPVNKAWAEEARGALRHPDEHDLEDARIFAREMRSKV
ncbi:MAG: flavodoxin family protein [Smithella sp.]|nr:flavodoxin family protein [Smithella sp.]